MIKLDRLTRRFGSTVAVDDISLDIPSGSIYGLLGPNGAGKTTTIKMLTTLLTPTSGTATVAGSDIVAAADEVRRKVGYVPEQIALYQGLTANEYIEFAGHIRALPDHLLATRTERLLAHFGLHDDKDRRLTEFSKGMQRKVLMCAALLHDPEVLILDEPMEGLDVKSQAVLKSALREFVAAGKTVLYSSHVLEVVEVVCTHVAVIDHGHIITSGKITDLLDAHRGQSLSEIFLELTGGDGDDGRSLRELLGDT